VWFRRVCGTSGPCSSTDRVAEAALCAQTEAQILRVDDVPEHPTSKVLAASAEPAPNIDTPATTLSPPPASLQRMTPASCRSSRSVVRRDRFEQLRNFARAASRRWARAGWNASAGLVTAEIWRATDARLYSSGRRRNERHGYGTSPRAHIGRVAERPCAWSARSTTSWSTWAPKNLISRCPCAPRRALRVHHPRGVERHQPRRLHLRCRVGDHSELSGA